MGNVGETDRLHGLPGLFTRECGEQSLEKKPNENGALRTEVGSASNVKLSCDDIAQRTIL